MKQLYRPLLGLALLLGSLHAQGQNQRQHLATPYSLGSQQQFLATLQPAASTRPQAASTVRLDVAPGQSLTGRINYQHATPTGRVLIGSVENVPASTFSLEITDKAVTGQVLLGSAHKAYTYSSSDQGEVLVTEADEEGLICTGYPVAPAARQVPATTTPQGDVMARESNPGAPVVLFLDFDGADVPAGTRWNNGNPISAATSGMSDAAIQEAWEIVSEDYRHFNVNVTTDQAVFDAVPRGRRLQCIITPTDYFYPGAGGVAYTDTYQRNAYAFYGPEHPCFVFNLSSVGAGEAASHELGHCFTLQHDGVTTAPNPSLSYYYGHGNWAPIMGVGYYVPVVQWSRGEYINANNGQDDVAIIGSFTGYVNDDHSDNASQSTPVTRATNPLPKFYGRFSGEGIINSQADRDFFSFTAGAGDAYISVYPVAPGRAANVDLLIRLYDANRVEIAQATTVGSLPATLNATLAAGTYYFSVDGTGELNPVSTGYSDYGSLGRYAFSGRTNGEVPFTTPIPIGQAIWLKANNGKYVTSNVFGNADMWSDRTSVGSWEQFTVVDAGNGQIALYNNGRYVVGESSSSRMVCDRINLGSWESFDWISNADGTISLRASNSLYVTSANGQSAMRCDRGSIGPWEKFAWGTGSGRPAMPAATLASAALDQVQLYPNPITGNSVRYTLPEGLRRHTVLVRDVYGHVLLERAVNDVGTQLTLETGSWKPGLYTVTIVADTFRKTIQVEKQ